MLLAGGFTALLLLITSVSAEKVPPPTDVTVSCRSLQITVHWKYSKREPQTRFVVNVLGSAGTHEAETTDHQYDLSHFIWESEERYMGFIYVNVTAVQGGNKSVPVSSESFTYKSEKTARIKCEFDFPPVNLTVKGSQATVSFQNPLHYYGKLKKAIKQDTSIFTYGVSLNGIDFDVSCRIEDDICKQVRASTEGVESCVKLKGALYDGKRFGHVPFRETDEICASESSDEAQTHDVYVMTLVTLLAIFVLVIIVITLMIYKVRAWTMKTPRLPASLVWPQEKKTPKAPLPICRVPRCNIVPEGDTSLVELIVHNNKCPSVTSEEEIDPYGSLKGDGSAGSDLQPPAECMYMEGGLSESGNEELGAEGHGTDDDSVKTECVSLVSGEEERSAYDCPHTLMDMGDGDIVSGYNK